MDSTTNSVFKFINLRSPQKKNTIPETILLKTDFLKKLARVQNNKRYAEINENSADTIIEHQEINNIYLYGVIRRIIKKILNHSKATGRTYKCLFNWYSFRSISSVDTKLLSHTLNRLSDTLLAHLIESKQQSKEFDDIRTLYNGYLILDKIIKTPEDRFFSVHEILQTKIENPFNDSDMDLESKPVYKPVKNKIKFPKIESVGIGDLLVVKKHIKRYDKTEIAHIENIMPGETRERRRRDLEKIEDIRIFEAETTTNRETETQSTERFELNRETTQTIKEEQKFGFDLSISGKYGPTIKFDSNLSLDRNRSTESTNKSVSNYAKDIVDRSLERIEKRVGEKRIRKVLKEIEENNLHSFVNGTRTGESGIYQFVDKIYEAQVFNYGKRQMFDLIIPEPASFLWFLKTDAKTQVAKQAEAPKLFDIGPFDILYQDGDKSNQNYYGNLAKEYGVSEIAPPPDEYSAVTVSESIPKDGTKASEADQPRSQINFDIPIPEGYRPEKAIFSASAVTDNVAKMLMAITADKEQAYWDPPREADRYMALSGGKYLCQEKVEIDFQEEDYGGYPDPITVKVNLVTWETGTHSVTIFIKCRRIDEEIKKWQLQTYEKLRNKYMDQLFDYKDKEASLEKDERKEEQKQVYGASPTKKKQIMVTELKKHCISAFTNQWYDEFSALRYKEEDTPTWAFSDRPPQFDFFKLDKQQKIIRFLEQAFEWSQMQYAFYPYYWANKDTWSDRFTSEDPNYEFQQFLQAGAARVVVSVRPGFEEAVSHYMDNDHELWNGEDDIHIDHPLYVSIIQEIKERSDESVQAEYKVGNSWEIRMPTDHIILRDRPGLPAWSENPPGSWEWGEEN